MAKKAAAKVNGKENGMSVAETIRALKEKYGDDSIMKLGDKPKVGVDAISTGSIGLDIILGVSGLPRGRMIEVFGPQASGKTTLALHTVAQAQMRGGVCAYMDAENAMDPDYAKKLGVKIEDLHISQPQSAEQALDMVDTMVRSDQFDVIVIDSVAALTPIKEVEGEMGQQQMGSHARLMSQACRKLNSQMGGKKTVLIFINQIRTAIGAIPGMPTEYTPGGRALAYYTSVRLDIRRIAQIKKGDEIIGGRTRIKVVKNKVAAPYKQTELDILYNEGISREGEIIALGTKYGIIDHPGTSYSFKGSPIGLGYDRARQFLKANRAISDDILELIKERLDKDSLFSASPDEVTANAVPEDGDSQ